MDVQSITGPAPIVQRVPGSFWFVGCGNMAGAMVEGWRQAGMDLSSSVAIRPSARPVEGLRTVRSQFEAGSPPEYMLLGFKPQLLDEVASDLRRFSDGAVIISILAGVELASLAARFPSAKAIVRAMPNLPVALRRGVVALVSDDADEALRQRLGERFRQLGTAIWSPNEASFGAVGAVAGAGPAYVARFIEALAAAGQARGLDPALALTVARETVFGTAWLAASTGEPMDEIVARVRSPKGTTDAGLAVLDAELPGLIDRTLTAAGRRSAELAEAARQIDSPATLA
jgi:pyrroline-5-carboxylate reductase